MANFANNATIVVIMASASHVDQLNGLQELNIFERKVFGSSFLLNIFPLSGVITPVQKKSFPAGE